MKRLQTVVLTAALAAALVGCGYKLVPAEPTSLQGIYSVHPQVEWSGIEDDHVVLWTVHGPGLEALRFVLGVEDGQALFEPSSEKQRYPEFHPGMSPTEIVELFVDTLSIQGVARVTTSDLRPAPFGQHEGFRFELAYVTGPGLEMSGIVAGAVVEQKLHLILFTAPRAHYFESLDETVDRLIASVDFD